MKDPIEMMPRTADILELCFNDANERKKKAKQEKTQVRCVPPAKKLHVLQWPPPDVVVGGSSSLV